MPTGDEKGKKMRDLGEDKGLTLVCRCLAGGCFHSAVSLDELPDVIFWGVDWDSQGWLWVLVAQREGLARRVVGLRISGRSSSEPRLEQGCLWHFFACMWSCPLLSRDSCPLRKGLAGSAWTFCSLAGCMGLQQTLVPLQSSVDVAENSGCMAYVLSMWVISFKSNNAVGLFLEAFF